MRAKTFIKWGALTGLLAYVVTISVWANTRALDTLCSKIEVEVLNPSNSAPLTKKGIEEEIKALCPDIIGKKVSLINTKDIESHLKKAGNFEDVECLISPLGTLKVRATQMIPVLRVFDSTGSYYINCEGKRMKSSHEFYNDVPIVVGNFNKQLNPKYVLPVVEKVEKDPTLKNLVTMYKVDSPHDILLSTRMTGHVVNIGDTSNLDYKFRNLLSIYRQVMPEKGWNTYDTISVKFYGQVVATRADKAPQLHSQPYEEELDPEEKTLSEYEGEAPTMHDSLSKQP